MAVIDVSDATFEAEVMARSDDRPVVVDLWAPWCGPCTTLGPIIEQAVDATEGEVVLAKINVDENPQASQIFQVQGIPAVFAISERKIVNSFVGAQGEEAVTAFVQGLLPSETDNAIAALIEAGDEASLLQALELEADNEGAVLALAELLIGSDRADEAMTLLERLPDTAGSRRVKALARTGANVDGDEDIDARLATLLSTVKHDDDARQQFVDLLELLGADDERTTAWRKKLTTALF